MVIGNISSKRATSLVLLVDSLQMLKEGWAALQ